MLVGSENGAPSNSYIKGDSDIGFGMVDPKGEFQRAHAANLWRRIQDATTLSHYLGRPYMRFDDRDGGSFRTVSTEKPWTYRMVNPIIPKAIAYQIGLLADANPKFNILPATDDDEDVRRADVCTSVVDALNAANKIEVLNEKELYDLCLFGRSWEKVYYDPTARVLTQTFDEIGMEKIAWQNAGDIRSRHCNAAYVECDPGAVETDDIQWVAERQIVTSAQAWREHGVKAKDENQAAALTDWILPFGNGTSIYRVGVEVYQYYHVPTLDRPRGSMMVSVAGKPRLFATCPNEDCQRTLGKSPDGWECFHCGTIDKPTQQVVADLPYYEATNGVVGIPYVLLTNMNAIVSPLGMTMVQHTTPQATAVNRLESLAMEHAEEYVHPPLLVPKGNGSVRLSREPRAQMDYESRDGKPPPSFMNMPALSQDFYALRDQHIRTADAAAGSATTQEAAASGGGKTATNGVLNFRENGMKADLAARGLIRGAAKRVEMWLALAKAYYREDRVLRIAGKNKRTSVKVFNENDLDYADIQIIPGSARARDPFIEAQTWIQFYNIAPDNMKPKIFEKLLGLNLVDRMDEGPDYWKQSDENRRLALGEYVAISIHDDHAVHESTLTKEYIERHAEWGVAQHIEYHWHCREHAAAQDPNLSNADPVRSDPNNPELTIGTGRPALFDPATGLSVREWREWMMLNEEKNALPPNVTTDTAMDTAMDTMPATAPDENFASDGTEDFATMDTMTGGDEDYSLPNIEQIM